jgi:hypothetical protein
MQNHVSSRPRKISSIVAFTATSLNLLVVLFVGFFFFFAYGVADPGSDSINLEIFYSQKARNLWTIGLLTLVFIIIFLTSLVLWLLGKRFSSIFLLSITLLHALGIVVLRDILFPVMFFGALALDLVILVIILLEKKYPFKYA